ncbi:hypothetical protein VTI74DRAFT_3832 [Chaetomium olivicolor]
MDGRKRSEQLTTDDRREPRYHVYVRLPFNRGDFVDPGPVNWSEKKSEVLWSILSGPSPENVDWTKLATQFDVSVEFLLQMANYLTERHTTQLRAQMLKAAAIRGSAAPSPAPGADGGFQVTDPLRRTASGASRAPSALSIRKEVVTPLPRHEEGHGGAGTSAAGRSIGNALPGRPGSSRNSSGSRAVPPQIQPGSRPGTATRFGDPQRRPLSYLATPPAQQQQILHRQQEEETEIPPPSPERSTSSSSSSSDSFVQSRIIRRPPRFQSRDPRTGGNSRGPFNGDDDDDDDEPAFLPYKAQSNSGQGMGSSSGQDLGATLRGNMRDLAIGGRAAADTNQSQTSDSSAGSTAIVPRRPGTARGTAGDRRLPSGDLQHGPLSPRRTAELAGRGPGSASRRKGSSRDGSDGTPSMGSSFSDLDDTSVTQSALEEALASRMQDGTIGSRMSVIGGTLGQALRSRYLPKSNR